MSKKEFEVKINLGGLSNELHNSLKKSIYLVSTGLQVKENIKPESLVLPSVSISLQLDGGLVWNSEQLYENYFNWVLTNGFRDVIENANSFLESAHKVLSFWQLSEKQSNSEITGLDWNQIIVGGSKKFHKMGFPDKFIHFENEHNIVIDPKLKEQTFSINSARNCLVHRNGIVGSQDVTSNDMLEIKYSRMQLYIKNDDGETKLEVGQIVEKGGAVFLRIQDEIKSFKRTERITFTTKEFSDVVWNLLWMFGNHVVKKVEEYGITNGHIPKPVSST